MKYYVVNRRSGMFFESYDKDCQSVSYTAYKDDARVFSSRSSAKYWEKKLNDGYGRDRTMAISQKEIDLYM